MVGQATFFDRLLEVPLFQGISRGEFMEIVGKYRLGFHRKKNASIIVRQDDVCGSLVFVLGGEFCQEHESDDHGFSVWEWGTAPAVIQPERLFGLHNRYGWTVKAASHVQLLEIDKHSVVEILSQFEIFRLNFLNLVSTQTQYGQRRLWKSLPESPEKRFARFVADRCLRPAGHKTLRIGMIRLADELGVTRLTVSKMLRALENDGLLSVGRQQIDIPSLEQLIQQLSYGG